MKTRNSILLSAAALLAFAAQANAATILGVSINDVSSEDESRRTADRVIDGSGGGTYVAGGTSIHATNPNETMWLTEGNSGDPNYDPMGAYPNTFIEFDLGDNYDLSFFTVWNYNESANSATQLRGAQNVTISVASSLAGSFTSLGTFGFNIAPNDATTAFGQDIDLSSFTAADSTRAIRFDITSNHGDATGRTGLAEVRFDGVAAAIPEPSTSALIGLAGLALILRRRK